MSTQLNIKKVLVTVLVVLGILAGASGCKSSAGNEEVEEPPDARPLVLLEWSGYELPEFHPQFTAKYPNLEPQYKFFEEDAAGFAIAQSGFQFDLTDPCINFWQLYVDNGLLQPIDTSRITNWNDIFPALRKQGEFNGQQYFVPYSWGYESIIVRTDKVSEIPDSWGDLWNPEYAGHVSVFDSGESNHIITALILGFDPWNTTPEQNEQITQKLLELKPNLLNYWADFTELANLVAAGDVWLASSAWGATYSELLNQGVPVEYIKPVEGRMGWLCGFGLSAQSTNVDMAYDYINAMLDPSAQAVFGDMYAYGVVTPQAVDLMDDELVAMMELGDPSILDKTVFYKALNDAQREMMTNRWTEIKAAP